MLTFTTLFLVIVGSQQFGNIDLASSETFAWMGGIVDYLQTFRHLEDFSRGSSIHAHYYTSTAALLLGLSTLVIEAKA